MKAVTTLEPEQTMGVLKQALQEVYGADAQLETWTSDAQFTEHGKRRVVRYDLQAHVAGLPNPQHCQWVGKYYEEEGQALLVASVLRIIRCNEAARAAGLVVPKVLSYYAPCHLLFLTYESGESVTTAIPGETEAILATMGRALAALHGMQITPPTTTSPATVLAELRWRVEDLSAWFAGEESNLRKAFAQLGDQAPKPPSPISFIHNDFGPANLLWRAGELIVLDFDKCARGDPALDLGNFLVQLRRRSICHPERFRDFAAARRALFEAYERWSSPDRGLGDRVTWYERAILLRKAHRLCLEGKNQGSDEGAQHIVDGHRLLTAFLEDSAPEGGSSLDTAGGFAPLLFESKASEAK